jgi:hypothetical protein
MASQFRPASASPERPQSKPTRRSPTNSNHSRGSPVNQLIMDDPTGMALSDMPLSELKAQMEMTMGGFDASTGTSQHRPMSGESAEWASTPSARPALGGKTYISTGRPPPLQISSAAPVDPYEPLYEPHDLHSDVAAELRLQGGVVGRVHFPKREKVHLGPYLRCNFNVAPTEQLVSVPHKLLLGDRPSTASPRMQAVPPNSPRCRAASAAPRSRGGGLGRVSLATAGHAVGAVTGKKDGDLSSQKAFHDVFGLHQRSLGAAELLAVRRREDCLRQLRHMLHTALRVRGPCSRLSGVVSVQYQRLLGETVLSLLRRSVEVVLAAEGWRAAAGAQGAKLLKVKNELRTVPEAFVHNGANYLLKMLTDMDGLPLPGGSDPFFLKWFGRDSRWWHIPGCVPLELINPAQCLTAEDFDVMQRAEKVLLDEATLTVDTLVLAASAVASLAACACACVTRCCTTRRASV